MAKHSNFHDLPHKHTQINLTLLCKSGYLKSNQLCEAVITWDRVGCKLRSASIWISTHIENSYIELDYQYDEKPINYRIPLVSVPSNLGVGIVWFFVCPDSGKRCRKLYFNGTHFLHREAFTNFIYEKQTLSKANRQLNRLFEVYYSQESLYDELDKKHFKYNYAGKPTRKYLTLIDKIEKAESMLKNEIKRLGLHEEVT